MIIYEDNERVVVMTGLRSQSSNRKTGPMLQVWILVKAEDPVQATKSGRDELICGQCPHRPKLGNSCYVNVGQAPLAVWKAWRAGRYPVMQKGFIPPYPVRLGAYGDPAFVPFEVWERLLRRAPGWTGYTHQWRQCDQRLRKFCMASVDSPEEALEAWRLGWRTFRVAAYNDAKAKHEVLCPASRGLVTCSKCLACGGGNRRGSIFIRAHGPKAGSFDRWRQDRLAAAHD